MDLLGSGPIQADWAPSLYVAMEVEKISHWEKLPRALKDSGQVGSKRGPPHDAYLTRPICTVTLFGYLGHHFGRPRRPLDRTVATYGSLVKTRCRFIPIRVKRMLHLGHHWDTISTPSSTKVIRKLKKYASKEQADTKLISDPPPSSPKWLKHHKYHMFQRVQPNPFEWLWGHFEALIRACLGSVFMICGLRRSWEAHVAKQNVVRSFQTLENWHCPPWGRSGAPEGPNPVCSFIYIYIYIYIYVKR